MLRLWRIRHGHRHSGVLARCACSAANERDGSLHTALIGLVGRNKRRYGGYLVHVGVVLMFLGFAGESFKLQETALLKPGQEVKIGEFVVRLDALRVTDDIRKQAVTAHITATRDGAEIAKLYPGQVVLPRA